MKSVWKAALWLAALAAVALVPVNIWGYLTQGQYRPVADPERDPGTNRMVMVFGATGAVGDGLLQAAMEDPEVERIHVVSRRSSPRIDAAVASGKAMLHLQDDFTDYANLAQVLGEVNTVMWGLGTSFVGMDDATYTRIHVDFPLAFMRAWLAAQPRGPLSFHFVTGMGTDPDSDTHWAREKGRAEIELARLVGAAGGRSFGYRSGLIRRTDENCSSLCRLAFWLARPGSLAVTGPELGRSMLEISARTGEVPNGALIDNADTIAFAAAASVH